MYTGRHCEVTNNEFGSQVVLDESRADDVTVPIRIETGQIRSKLRHSRPVEISEQHTVSPGPVQGQRIKQTREQHISGGKARTVTTVEFRR